jgi:hypothetical protein
MESTGRITLPPRARLVADERVPIRAVTRGPVLVLRAGGVGAPLLLDGRGRLALPAFVLDSFVDDAVGEVG